MPYCRRNVSEKCIMLEMIESTAEKTNEQQEWLRSLRENNTARQKKRAMRDKEKKTLEEENERLRSFVNRSR